MVATIGSQLDPLGSLYEWRAAAEKRGVAAWFFAANLAALERRYSKSTKPLMKGDVERQLTALGIEHGANPFYGSGWADVPLDLSRETNTITACYAGARLYTFLAYRRGLQRALEQNAFTAEQAVHAYVRVALAWVEQWPGLTLATESEWEQERGELRERLGRQRLTPKDNYEATLALPFILEQDLRDLVDVYDRAERNASGGSDGTSSGGSDAPLVIAQQLVGQIRLAAIAMIDDPSLRVLSAYNMVRAKANSRLGGALARARLSSGDFVLATLDSDMARDLVSGAWNSFSLEKQQAMLSAAPVWNLMLGKPKPKPEPEGNKT